MKSKKISNGYIVVIEKGEEIMETLTTFCEQNNIKSGNISGIGGTDDVSLNYYDLEKKEYITKRFSGKNFEIVSLNGNISLVEDKPFAHIHIMLGDSDYNIFGGHLKSATIAITCEIVITMADDTVKREYDDEFEVNLISI